MLLRYCFILLLGLAFCHSAFGQLVLKNTATQKTKTLPLGGEVRLTIDMDQSGVDYKRVLEGELTSVQSQLIKVLPKEEEQHLLLDNGLIKTTTIEYEALIGLRPLAIEIEGLQEVAYRGKNGLAWDGLGGLLTILGGLSTLVVAPLASINYSNGDFNQDRYYQWAGYSLAATGVGIGILIVNGKKKYAIQAAGQAPNKQLWKIHTN
jgi:hypothetical protein